MRPLKISDLIIFEDDDIIAVNKPPFIVSEADNTPDSKSLADLLKEYCSEVMLCHRLDKETTGIILGAKNKETYSHISKQFAQRKIEKIYHALVSGIRDLKEAQIELPLGKKGTGKGIVDMQSGKPSTTIVNTREVFKHFTLLEAKPLTGRFHQVRVHLSSVGCPLVGDELYGGKSFFLSEIKRKYNKGKDEEELPLLSRAALHARSISFTHPNGTEMNLEAPYYKDLENVLRLLRKFDSNSH